VVSAWVVELGYFVLSHSCAGFDGAVVGQTVVWV
jgi:hypothetical protein